MRSINLWRGFIIELVVAFNGAWCLYDFTSARNNSHVAQLSLAAGSHSQVDVFNYQHGVVSPCSISKRWNPVRWRGPLEGTLQGRLEFQQGIVVSKRQIRALFLLDWLKTHDTCVAVVRDRELLCFFAGRFAVEKLQRRMLRLWGPTPAAWN